MFWYKIMKVGNSAAVTIPKRFLKAVNLHIGEQVALEMSLQYKILIMKPLNQAANHYFLTPDYFKWLKDQEKNLKSKNDPVKGRF